MTVIARPAADRWGRGLLGAAIAIGTVAGGSACRQDGWDPDAQFAPSLRPVVGVRVDDGEVRLWLGRACEGVTGVRAVLETDGGADARFAATAPDPGVRLLRMRLTDDGRDVRTRSGLEVIEPLPADFEVGTADELVLSLAGATAWGTRTELRDVVEGSPKHDPDTYYFDQIGWLGPEQVADRDGEDFLTPCTPDPERS